MKNTVIITCFALCLGISLPAFSEDGASLYISKGCAGCHGADGGTPLMPGYPKISMQNPGYIIAQLKDFKSGKRTNGNAALMTGIVTSLTDDDIKNLAEYLASPAKATSIAESTATVDAVTDKETNIIASSSTTLVETTVIEEPAMTDETMNNDTSTAKLYVEKACIACHGANGLNPAMDAYPVIGGQTDSYLLTQMKEIKSGIRINSHSVAMANIMDKVSNEDMVALANWLSRQKDSN